MARLVRYLHRYLGGLAPEERDYLIGAGLAFNPLPTVARSTFYQSDEDALGSDLTAVGADMKSAADEAHGRLGSF